MRRPDWDFYGQIVGVLALIGAALLLGYGFAGYGFGF